MYDGDIFQHDGEHEKPYTGYGCDCDNGYVGNIWGSHSSGSGKGLLIALFVAVVIGAVVNELLGGMIALVVLFVVMVE